MEAPRRVRENFGRLQDGSKSAPGGFKTLQDGSKSVPGGSKTPQEHSGRLQDSPKRCSRRLKTASRAFWDASRQLQQRSWWFETAPRALGRPEDGEAAEVALSSLLGQILRLRISSASPQVGVQKCIRRNYLISLSSNLQASGHLAPCMAMHRFTLAFWESSRQLQQSSGSFKTAPRALGRPEDGSAPE